jgi:hypothetical protein
MHPVSNILTLGITLVEANRILAGAIIMGYFVVGLFFLRFWRKTRDRLFAMFAAAFWILMVNRLLHEDAHNLVFYTVRLVAFALLLVAIVDKNRSARQPRVSEGS